MPKMLTAIGLMSGTSFDGIDAAIIKTDGTKIVDTGYWLTIPYKPELRERLREVIKGKGDWLTAERDQAIAHADAVKKLLNKAKIPAKKIDLIGFHGQTIIHRPNEGITWQMGNPSLLAELTGISVVGDFRRRDVACGGQGAPLVPLYHAALIKKFDEPVAILNIGGVSNVTYIERTGKNDEDLKILGFDTGPGNALLDDWIHSKTGKSYDEDGKISGSGKVNGRIIKDLLADKFFSQKPPKSLDRNHFYALSKKILGKYKLSVEDGAATLSAFTAWTAAKAENFLHKKPKYWFVCGGGRLNRTIMMELSDNVSGKVDKIEVLGVNGDSLEAQAFAFLAVRSYYGMNLTVPETTGTKRPVTGGAFYRA